MKTTGIHVLIAEDDAAHASAIRRAFEAGGPETVIKVVGTLREFRQRSVEWPPNIAVMDLNLPDGRAVEVLTSPPEAGPFPVLVMTSYGNEQVAVRGDQVGRARLCGEIPGGLRRHAAYRHPRPARMETAPGTQAGGGGAGI